MQLVAADAPVVVRYFPATHAVQLVAEDAVVAKWPAAQDVQAEFPVVAEYRPAKHAAQLVAKDAPTVER